MCELRTCHLTRGHREIAMPDFLAAAYISFDLNVVRGSLNTISAFARASPANESMGSEASKVARATSGRHRFRVWKKVVEGVLWLVWRETLDQLIHLGDGEASDADPEVDIGCQQLLQLKT